MTTSEEKEENKSKHSITVTPVVEEPKESYEKKLEWKPDELRKFFNAKKS